MLMTLRRIVQEVNAAGDLTSALRIIVERVKVAMKAEACSVYLFDRDSERYTLMASEGLNPEMVGHLSLGRSEGLVGQVGLREEPINLADASSHPKFLHIAKSGEQPFHAFLGVPIIHHRQILGVLVVQQRQKRRFGENEESFMVTMSAQLAAVIAHAEATGTLVKETPQKPAKLARFQGVAGAQGMALGTAVVMMPAADLGSVPEQTAEQPELELEQFNRALEAVRQELRDTSEKLACHLPPEELALFDVYLRMLDDNALAGEIRQQIEQGDGARWALRQIIERHVHQFELMEDAYLRERATDVKDLGRRILCHLKEQNPTPQHFPEQTILISEELTPAMLGQVPRAQLAGLVSVQGSSNSHVAILARAMGVPTVMGAIDLPYQKLEGRELIVDGNSGRVYSNPNAELRRLYQEVIDEEQQLSRDLAELKDRPCTTRDAYRLPLWVNTGLMSDIHRSLDHGAEGVGLYRTEVPFMIRERFPSEKEQQEIYQDQLAAFAPNLVTMRTLDIGGDKALSYFPIEEENPFLGWRGIRISLDHPEIFLVQVRAMLKASMGLNNLRIMLPMITSVPEVEDALHLVHRAHSEVVAEGVHVPLPPVGVMIEVPAAVYQVREIAKRVDFLSIGSNDLTQYLLAVDRNNPQVAALYNSYHPAVLAALRQIVRDAHAENTSVSICGEMAGDPAAAVLLMAMGFDVLSMNANNLPKVKWILRNITLARAREILDEVMQYDNPQLIQSTLELLLKREGLSRIFAAKPGRLSGQI